MAAREHASRCPLCRQFLEEMRRLSDRIRLAVPRPEAPADVRDRLFKVIARARIDGREGAATRRRRLWSAVAAAGLLAGGTWLAVSAVSERTPGPDPLGTIAQDHLRSQRHPGLASADSLEVARWLGERVPFPVAIPLFPDGRVTGARLLLANGQSGAVVDYLIGGRPLSYYILPAAGGGSGSESIRVTSRAGYRIAAWEDGGLTHALVAELPGRKLVELAHYCIEQTAGRPLMSTAERRQSPERGRAPAVRRRGGVRRAPTHPGPAPIG